MEINKSKNPQEKKTESKLEESEDENENSTNVEELQRIVKKYKSKITELEKDREELEDEVDQLQSDIDTYRDPSKKNSSQPSFAELRHLQSEKSRLERELEFIAKDMDKLKDSLQKEKEARNQFEQDLREEKERNIEIEREIEVYRKESIDFRKQLGASQQQLATVEVDEKDFRVKIQLKNKEIENYVNEIQSISIQNNNLTQEVKHLSEELEMISHEAEIAQTSVVEYRKLLGDVEKQYIAMENERDSFSQKLEITSKELKEQRDFGATLWNQTTSKLKEWEKAVKERDLLIQEKDQLLSEMYEELNAMKQQDITLGKYDDTFDGMKKAIHERDQLILSLQSQILSSQNENSELNNELLKLEQGQGSEIQDALKNHRNIVNRLKEEISNLKKSLQQEKQAVSISETSAEDSQQLIIELREKIELYEKGFGIDDAMLQLRESKAFLNLREKEINQLNKQLSIKEQQMKDLYDENEVLRIKGGVDLKSRVSIKDLQLKEKLELEQLRASNKLFEHEIQKLEEERTNLKSALRLQAFSDGEIALKLGISHDQLSSIRKLQFPGSGSESSFPSSNIVFKQISSENAMKEIQRELANTRKTLAMVQLENDELLDKFKNVQSTNISMTPTNQIMGDSVPSLIQGIQIQEVIAIHKELEFSKSRIKELEEDLGRKRRSKLPRPESLSPDMEEDLYFLNLQLVERTDQLSKFENLLNQTEKKILLSNQQNILLKEQLSLIYSDFIDLQRDSNEKLLEAENQISFMKSQLEDSNQKNAILHQITDKTFDPKQVEIILEDQILQRKYKFAVETEDSLRKEIQRLKSEKEEMESSLKEQIISFEEKFKKLNSRNFGLQKIIEESVPRSHFNILLLKFNQLSIKHKDILVIYEQFVTNSQVSMVSENIDQDQEVDQGDLDTSSFTESKSFPSSQSELQRKIIELESRENSSKRKMISLKKKLILSENSNKIIEEKLSLTEKERSLLLREKHILLDSETNFKEKLLNSLSTEESQILKSKLSNLQDQNDLLKIEIQKYKQLHEISLQQFSQLKEQRDFHFSEIKELKQTIRDLQSKSEKDAQIGSLHHQLLSSQLNEVNLKRKLEIANKDISRFNNDHLRLEKLIEEQTELLFNLKDEHFQKIKSLQSQIDNREQMEKDLLLIQRLTTSLSKAELKSRDYFNKMQEMEEIVQESEGKVKDLNLILFQKEELFKSLQISDNSSRNFIEIQEQNTQLKIMEKRLQRQFNSLSEKEKYLTAQNKELERNVQQLEERLIFEDDQFQSKISQMRERISDLERKLADKEMHSELQLLSTIQRNRKERNQQSESDLDLPNRLHLALDDIEVKRISLFSLNEEIKSLHQTIDSLSTKIQEQQSELDRKDLQIQDLKIRFTSKQTNLDLNKEEEVDNFTLKMKTLQTLYIHSQDEVSDLRNLLQSKDLSVLKYQSLIQQTRESYLKDLESANQRISQLSEEIHNLEAKAILKIDQPFLEISSRQQNATTSIPISQLDETVLKYELLLKERTAEMNQMKSILLQSKESFSSVQEQLNSKDLHFLKVLQDRESLYSQELNSHQETIDHLNTKLQDFIIERENQLKETGETIFHLKSRCDQLANEVQSQAQKIRSLLHENSQLSQKSQAETIQRLSNQLDHKSKQIETLEDALAALKKQFIDRVSTATLDNSSETGNISELKRKITELEQALAKEEQMNKKRKERENLLSANVQKEKEDFLISSKKQNAEINRLQKALMNLQKSVGISIDAKSEKDKNNKSTEDSSEISFQDLDKRKPKKVENSPNIISRVPFKSTPESTEGTAMAEKSISGLQQQILSLSKLNRQLEEKCSSIDKKFSILEQKTTKEKLKYEETIGLLEYKLRVQEMDLEKKNSILKTLKKHNNVNISSK